MKEISASVCAKGEILLSITTYHDLGWIDEVEKDELKGIESGYGINNQ